MITVLSGENTFEIRQAMMRLRDQFAGVAELVDGSELELRDLPGLLMGATLFADKRLVIIKQLSDNTAVWNELPEWLGRVADDIHLVLIDQKPDKRTRTYKELKSVATMYEFPSWTERDSAKAERWLVSTADSLDLTLTSTQARLLVQRIGIDQWQLHGALEKLATYDKVTDKLIDDIIDATPSANVFALLEVALRGDRAEVRRSIATLETIGEPYQLLSLLGSQVFQLAVLTTTDKPVEVVAKDIGAHPYALRQLARLSRGMSRTVVRKAVAALAEADHDSKTTGEDPWLLIERALLKIAAARSR